MKKLVCLLLLIITGYNKLQANTFRILNNLNIPIIIKSPDATQIMHIPRKFAFILDIPSFEVIFNSIFTIENYNYKIRFPYQELPAFFSDINLHNETLLVTGFEICGDSITPNFYTSGHTEGYSLILLVSGFNYPQRIFLEPADNPLEMEIL